MARKTALATWLVHVAVLVSFAQVAQAQDQGAGHYVRASTTASTSSPAPTPAASSRRWYGWQTLVTDGAFVSFYVLARAGGWTMDDTAQGVGILAGLFGMLLGTPTIHAAHGNWGLGLASLLMRVVAFLGAGAIGSAVGDPDEFAAQVAFWATLGIGFAAVMTVDAVVFGWDDPESDAPSSSGLRLEPMVAARGNGVTLGIGGVY